MFGWIKALFGAGPEAASKALDAGIAGLDKMFYTAEEKAEALQQLSDTWLKTQAALQNETSIRSVTRRIIAFSVIFPYVFLVLAAAVSYLFNPEYSKFLLQLAEGNFGWLVLGVAGFYFGPAMFARLPIFGGGEKK